MTDDQQDFAARLNAFTDLWREKRGTETLRNRLGRFLAHASPLLAKQTPAPTPTLLSAARLAPVLADLSPSLHAARSTGASLNPWAISGVKALEVRNSAVLATLWNPMRTGETATRFFGAFLAQLKPDGISLPGIPELVTGYHIRAEHCPDGDGHDRVDLVAETARHLIGIEIKIRAGLGENQLQRYVAAIKRLARLRRKSPAVIFLAPFPPPRPLIPNVVAADWSTVRTAARAVLPPPRSAYSFSEHLIASFARHIACY